MDSSSWHAKCSNVRLKHYYIEYNVFSFKNKEKNNSNKLFLDKAMRFLTLNFN